ncbi:MAG TPA: division/cell wall cluster transcriptional repressor MraZ [Nitrospirota bacterium]|nr:division/cell wall cluster transcriptional repressor MraZ [Nitrospirota bacterium]
MFRGMFEHTVDSKGRVSVPSRFRDIITDRYDGKLVLSMDYDRCLAVFPLEEWEKLEEKIKTLPMMKQEVKDFRRFLLSSAIESEMDKQGRILIPPTHREHAGITKIVKLVGIIDKIEIWDVKSWEERNSQNGDKIGNALSALGL